MASIKSFSNHEESFTSAFSRCSGYDRYASRRSIYEFDEDSGILADSTVFLTGGSAGVSAGASILSQNSHATSVGTVPSRFQFQASHQDITEEKRISKFKWAKKLLSKKYRPNDPLRILYQVATTKLSKRYALTDVELGKGVSGAVFLVTRKVDSEKLAAKTYIKKSYDGKYSKTKFLAKIAKEIILLAQLHHENVISTIDIVSYQDQIAVVMEYAPINVFQLVKDKLLSEEDILEYFSQLGAGVAYLHNECAVAHRDLKLENLGVGQDGLLKILDFGSAICLNPNSGSSTMPTHTCARCPPGTYTLCDSKTNSNSKLKLRRPFLKVRGLCGSDPYIAPEIWESVAHYKHPNANLISSCNCCRLCGYDPYKSDIWSLGVIFVAMMSGKFPWSVAKPSDNDFTTFKMHRRHRLTRFKLNSSSIKFTLGMLNLCPQDRLDIDQIMAYRHR